jgi:hypothetical protein
MAKRICPLLVAGPKGLEKKIGDVLELFFNEMLKYLSKVHDNGAEDGRRWNL